MRHLYISATIGSMLVAACSDGPPPDEVASAPATEEAAPSKASNAAAEEDIRHFLLQQYPDAGAMRYALAWADLDGDGTDEAIVHLVSPYFCGSGGCNTLVLTQAGPMWRVVGDISVSRTPVTVMDSTTGGWRDLTVAIGGGGGQSGNALLQFDGESYPSNPTVAPARMTEATGSELLPEDPELVELVGEVPDPASAG